MVYVYVLTVGVGVATREDGDHRKGERETTLASRALGIRTHRQCGVVSRVVISNFHYFVDEMCECYLKSISVYISYPLLA